MLLGTLDSEKSLTALAGQAGKVHAAAPNDIELDIEVLSDRVTGSRPVCSQAHLDMQPPDLKSCTYTNCRCQAVMKEHCAQGPPACR